MGGIVYSLWATVKMMEVKEVSLEPRRSVGRPGQ